MNQLVCREQPLLVEVVMMLLLRSICAAADDTMCLSIRPSSTAMSTTV